MGLVNYLTQIIVAMGIFIILCFFGEQIKKTFFKHHEKVMNPNEFLPKEEIFSLKQVHYLILILLNISA